MLESVWIVIDIEEYENSVFIERNIEPIEWNRQIENDNERNKYWERQYE